MMIVHYYNSFKLAFLSIVSIILFVLFTLFILGTAESLQGWRIQVIRRTGGLTQGTHIVYYCIEFYFIAFILTCLLSLLLPILSPFLTLFSPLTFSSL